MRKIQYREVSKKSVPQNGLTCCQHPGKRGRLSIMRGSSIKGHKGFFCLCLRGTNNPSPFLYLSQDAARQVFANFSLPVPISAVCKAVCRQRKLHSFPGSERSIYTGNISRVKRDRKWDGGYLHFCERFCSSASFLGLCPVHVAKN